MGAKTWALLAILSLLWGGSFLFVELALEGLPTLTVVWLRVAGAAGVLALWAALMGHGFAKGGAAWRALAVMGLLNNVLPFSLLVFAQGQIEAGLAAILNATTPLWTVLVAHVFTTDERITPAKALGIALGLGGVAVIAGGGAGQVVAIVACLGAALSYGLAGVWGRRFKAMGLAPPQVAFGMLASSSLILLPVWLVVERPWALAVPEAGVLWAVAALAILSTALAYLIFFRILASAGATFLSLVTLLIPPSALLLGIVVLGEALHLRHLAGMGLILLGLLAMDGRWVKWRG
jgi:drug/metabolite transporter (DMT)-like permease